MCSSDLKNNIEESEGEMEKFEYTQCSLNLKNKKAIVYRFANGETKEITVTDFDGNEDLFRKWKRLSDKYYIDERDLMYRISYKDISINELEDTDLTHLPSLEEVLVMREDDVEFTEEMNAFLDTLTDSQRRRLELRAFRGKSQTEIAEIEHIGQPRIHKTFVQISQKFKNFIENGASEGDKNRDFFILGERASYYERLAEKKAE